MLACKRPWPAAVLLDDLVDLLHQADGLVEGDDDLLVVGNVRLRERPAFAVLEPLLADLVAADAEVPHALANSLEAGGLGLVDPDSVLGPRDLFDLGIPTADELGDGLGELGRFEQVHGGEFAAEAGQRAE